MHFQKDTMNVQNNVQMTICQQYRVCSVVGSYKLKSIERRVFFDRFNVQQIQFLAFFVRLRLSHRLRHNSDEDSQTCAGHCRILVTPGILCVGFCPADSGFTLCSNALNFREIHITSSITQD